MSHVWEKIEAGWRLMVPIGHGVSGPVILLSSSVTTQHAGTDVVKNTLPPCGMLIGPAGPLQCQLCACAEKVTADVDLLNP